MAQGDRHLGNLECAVAKRYEVWRKITADADYFVLVLFDDADDPITQIPLSAEQLTSIGAMVNQPGPHVGGSLQ